RRGGCILLFPVRSILGGAGPRPVVTAGVAEVHPNPQPAVERDTRVSQVGPRRAELAAPKGALRPHDVAGGRRGAVDDPVMRARAVQRRPRPTDDLDPPEVLEGRRQGSPGL